MRAFKLALIGAMACVGPPAYLEDASSRRATLEASLVNPLNGYSTLRLAHYAVGGPSDWDALVVWNPPCSPLGPNADQFAFAALPLRTDAGEQAFFRYPVQELTAAESALVASAPASYGLWVDGARGVGGLVRVQHDDATVGLAVTCATCHAAERGGALVIGLMNATLDIGKLVIDAAPDDARAAAFLVWGSGRLDVTTTAGTEPVRIPDLRPVRDLTYLQHTASVAQRDFATLAVRIETQLIERSAETHRPPREIALALATYVWSLADGLTPRAPRTNAETWGQTIFGARCMSCHVPPSYTGPPVPLAVVGTDPTIGLSLDRGTGTYRVPSLRGVADRPLLLHDASVSSLDEMFDPARVTPAYSGRLGAPIAGHPFGLDLSDTDRAALLAFLRTL
jgi:hypothetical protein